MDKVIGFIIGLLLVIGCTNDHKFKKKQYDMLFIYNPWITVDFESKILKISCDSLCYTDTLYISKADETSILNSFERNKIDEISGERFYSPEYPRMPPDNFTIKLIENSRLKATITINDEYKEGGAVKCEEDYNVIAFRNDITAILRKNEGFQKALKKFAGCGIILM